MLFWSVHPPPDPDFEKVIVTCPLDELTARTEAALAAGPHRSGVAGPAEVAEVLAVHEASGHSDFIFDWAAARRVQERLEQVVANGGSIRAVGQGGYSVGLTRPGMPGRKGYEKDSTKLSPSGLSPCGAGRATSGEAKLGTQLSFSLCVQLS